MTYSELPWPFLGHQAWSWTTLRGNVFYYVYKRFFFIFVTFFNVLSVYLFLFERFLHLCAKISKPIQISLCMLMSLRIHLHGLHLDVTSVDTITQWREDWSSASVVNHTIVTDPTIRQPGFHLPRHTWSLMNRFRTGQRPCRANLHKWGLAQSHPSDCGQRQTMNHIVDTCPLTRF